MKEFPTLENENIILRKPELSDYDNYYAYVIDEKIAKQFRFNHTEETCKQRLESLIERYETEKKPLVWVIAKKETNELMGLITVDSISYGNKRFSIASGIIERYRGNHYCYQASKILITYIFSNMDMHRLELGHNIDNIASQKTIEKLGVKHEGIARESKYYDGTFVDRKIYSILKDEWIKE